MIAKYLGLAGLLLFTGCTSVQEATVGQGDGQDGRLIHLIYRSNHTGIVLNMAGAAPTLGIMREQFPGAPYLVFNWGDRNWYAGGARNPFTSAFALFAPSKSALRISSLPDQPKDKMAGGRRTSELYLSEHGYQDLLAFIAQSFLLNAQEQPIQLHAGKTTQGEFQVFAARGSYHLFQNSNSWSSQALAAAGVSRSMLRLVAGNIQF